MAAMHQDVVRAQNASEKTQAFNCYCLIYSVTSLSTAMAILGPHAKSASKYNKVHN